MSKKIIFLLVLISSIALFSCKYKVGFYEKTVAIPQNEWSSTYKPSFTIEISDTANLYNLYVIVRHTDAYHYNNLWVNFTSIAPGSVAETQKLNLTLGNNAKWLGSGMAEVFEHRILINRNPVKLHKGKYIFLLQNIMREDPLEEIMNVGIRVSKID